MPCNDRNFDFRLLRTISPWHYWLHNFAIQFVEFCLNFIVEIYEDLHL